VNAWETVDDVDEVVVVAVVVEEAELVRRFWRRRIGRRCDLRHPNESHCVC
jgi:ribosomal protein L22